MINKTLIYSYLLIIPAIAGCGVYSFTGASLPPEIKTVSVQYFFDEVGAGPPTLGQNFTEDLKDYLQQNTSLTIVEYDGDLQFEGSIVGYNFAPLAPRASGNQSVANADIAGLERLTITVNVSYINTYDESKNFDRRFSFFRDYDPQRSPLSQNEAQYIDEITENIIIDIFNATIADW